MKVFKKHGHFGLSYRPTSRHPTARGGKKLNPVVTTGVWEARKLELKNFQLNAISEESPSNFICSPLSEK